MSASIIDASGKKITVAGRGVPGKSAYDYAVDGGYTGTEEEFRSIMGSGPWVPLANNAGAHNSIYRGKFLGNTVTNDQYTAIAAGTFEDLFIGDYWTINNVNWRIAHFNYWMGQGPSPVVTENHVMLIPDSALYTCRYNANVVAYPSSELRQNGLTDAKKLISDIFSDHLLSHYENLVSLVSSGVSIESRWFSDSIVEVPNGMMIFGTYGYLPLNNGSNNVVLDSQAYKQLALFRLSPDAYLDKNSQGCWLRDVANSSKICILASNGRLSHINPTTEVVAVRPVFCIKK